MKKCEKVTNADLIRRMSDEEMAEYFGTEDRICPPDEICHCGGCIGCWLDWLKSEVEP